VIGDCFFCQGFGWWEGGRMVDLLLL
jgi:hypothetical protein